MVTDDDRKFVAFYEDVIAYRVEKGVLEYETHGKYTFPDDNAEDEISHTVLLHTTGTVNLQNGDWTWRTANVTGGTGRFANIQATPRENWSNDYGGELGGCQNPPGDPAGFPNIVLCHAVIDWTY